MKKRAETAPVEAALALQELAVIQSGRKKREPKRTWTAPNKYEKSPMVCNGFAVRYPYEKISAMLDIALQCCAQSGLSSIADYVGLTNRIAELIVDANKGGAK